MSKKPTRSQAATLAKKDPKDPVRILISWSPNTPGNEVIEYAAWLARSTPVRIRVVSTLSQPLTVTSMNKLSGSYKKHFRKQSEKFASAAKKALLNAGLSKSQLDENFAILAAGPSRPLLLTELAEDFRADVILLGAAQSAPKGRIFAGSTADTLLHNSPLPIGIIPRGIKLSKHGVTRINFAYTDRGNPEEPALLYAAQLAHTWGVPLRVLAFSAEGLVDVPVDTPDFSSSIALTWREHSLAMLDRAHDMVGEHFPELEVATEIGTGEGWSGAVDSLKWKKGDLLCLGSSPLGPIERVFIGSTATKLLPHMRVPVLVRPAEGPAFEMAQA
ncbi:universal stress protein [Corynebacterium sp.]|uniref:universal stress protein n=1 Tax=Corynebacterium sp. TaxID=1720 RepID=UPI0026DC496E|nr:universal stress protein [Corynebacterium sp.]MDO5033159.1 universal stress protein [Corynebacterium sp.]